MNARDKRHVEAGRYTFIFDYIGSPVEALRYGEPWKTFDVGDNATFALCHELHEVRHCLNVQRDLAEVGHKLHVNELTELQTKRFLAESDKETLRKALQHIQSMCGIPNASEACHKIMKYADDVLAVIK